MNWQVISYYLLLHNSYEELETSVEHAAHLDQHVSIFRVIHWHLDVDSKHNVLATYSIVVYQVDQLMKPKRGLYCLDRCVKNGDVCVFVRVM